MVAQNPARKSVELLNKYADDIELVDPDSLDFKRDFMEVKKILGPNADSVDYVLYGVLSSFKFDRGGVDKGFKNALARTQDSTTYHNYGIALRRLNRLGASIDALKTAYSKAPDSGTKSSLIGTLMASGMFDSAVQTLKQDDVECPVKNSFANILKEIQIVLKENVIDQSLLQNLVSSCLEFLFSKNVNFWWDIYVSSDSESSWLVFSAKIYRIKKDFELLVDINSGLIEIMTDYVMLGDTSSIVVLAEFADVN